MPKQLSLIFCVILMCCNSWVVHAQHLGEDRMLLSGDWKFHAIFGEGSNYLNIRVEEGDILTDNMDENQIETAGDWQVKSKAGRGTTFWGENYLSHEFKKGDTSLVRFHLEIPETGYYEHFVFFPFGVHLNARVNIKHVNGTDAFFFNQRNRCSQWLSLGIFKLKKGDKNFIEVTADSPRGAVADAVMLRPIPESKVKEAQEELAQIHLPDYEDAHWEWLKVPGHWGMLNTYSNYTGKGWYRKRFSLPLNWQFSENERVRLKFEAVYHVARVFLNGEFIGMHRGGFTPFEFDVTDKLKWGEPNLIAVEADNNFLVGATWNWGGIIRDVHLIKNKDVRIKYQYIHAEPNLETGTADLKLKLRIENNSSKTRSFAIHSNVSDDHPLTSLQADIQVEANSIKEINLMGILSSDQVKLWHFDAPHLYQIETRLSENKQELHRRKDRFGIRKVEITETQLLLNGEPVRLAGFNRVSDHRFWGSSEPQYILEKDVKLMKNAGANFMRIMHGTQNERLIDLCDEEGIMIIEEANIRELTNPEFQGPDYPLAKQWIKEMVERDCNHVSIIGWSVGNEFRDHYPYVETTINYVKSELDPYRLVSCVSNTGHRPGDTPENDPLGLSDIILQNVYLKTPDRMLDPIHEKWPDKPIFFSEFGLGRLASASLDEYLPGFADWHASIRGKNEFVVGSSLWTFNDYRSAYAETLEEENRAWGLVNTWRQKRRLYDQVQREYSPVKDIDLGEFTPESGSAAVIIPIRGLDDYPSYTLRDYQLVWEFRDVSGNVLESGTKNLPTIQPEDGEWKGEITWNALEENPFDFYIELKSSNGFVRYKKRIPFSVPNPPIISSIISGDGSVRIFFDKSFDVDEYHVAYQDEAGKRITSEKTIGNHIDVTNLQNDRTYSFTLIASNEKGSSDASESMEAQPNGMPLPPIIWDAFLADGKLVIGYSVEKNDEWFTVRYGPNENEMNKKMTTRVRGMLKVDIGNQKSISFQLRRSSGTEKSNWTNVVNAKTYKTLE